MAITLNGTTGITTPDLTVDTDTLVVDEVNNRVGIGTSSPAYKFDVTSATNTIGAHFYTPSGQSGIRIETAGNDKAVVEQYTNGNGNWRIGPGITTAGAYEFNSVTAGATRMLIDSSGRLLVGTTSTVGPSAATLHAYGADWCASFKNGNGAQQTINVWNAGTSGTRYLFWFETDTARTAVGSITTNGSTTSYNTSSDYRLKENIAPMTGALATVAQLNPVTYTWKSTGESSQGFIAHELQVVVPDCVTGEKDEVDEDGNPKYQGVDTSFLVATLTAAIQELKAELDTVKAELAALKGN